ncbi:hypothetical protein BJ508DRAFT_336503 [Ascobolus immersus RN42]|uniref:Uncharacterized protein n=1 Tax=Ascobolus immersus RN42 TaxID=1160509 RepID=A0A3N4HAZ0_ASCIM|nr:hypothetical protein BJ508DRAFT_336503 [Ascobolus immersus RN42]
MSAAEFTIQTGVSVPAPISKQNNSYLYTAIKVKLPLTHPDNATHAFQNISKIGSKPFWSEASSSSSRSWSDNTNLDLFNVEEPTRRISSITKPEKFDFLTLKRLSGSKAKLGRQPNSQTRSVKIEQGEDSWEEGETEKENGKGEEIEED